MISADREFIASRTQADYKKLGLKFRDKFGEVPIKVWKDLRSRKPLRKWRDELALTSKR
jgi:hypothetical protein